MTPQEMEARLKALEDEVTGFRNVEEIKKLQRIYGYYLEHWEQDKIADLFSDRPDTSVEIADTGVYLGKTGVKRFFARLGNPPPEFLHVMMQISGVVDVDMDGQTAKGRWYGFGVLAFPMEKGDVKPVLSSGVYENEYIKEDGKWKIHKLHWYRIFFTPYDEGWVKTPVMKEQYAFTDAGPADKPATAYKPYPSGYIAPYHYKHPITGK